jgi:hypothetical protein
MNLQEATQRVKIMLNQEIAPNTLRKACATGRLRGIRKGEGSMHIRRTEWDVTEEDVIEFVREEYHPRPSRRGKIQNKVHIPFREKDIDKDGLLFRVVEHLYQTTLPIHGNQLEKYDTRIVEAKISTRAKAEEIVQKLREAAQANKHSDQLQYGIETYVLPKKGK